VLMDEKEFSRRMKEWLNGGSWPEMDEYANNLGLPLDTSLLAAAASLAMWLFGKELDLSAG